MKKKIFLLIVMLVALFSVKEVNALVTVEKVTMNQKFSYKYLYSVKQNKLYNMKLNTPLSDVIDEDELVDGNSLIYVNIYVDNLGCQDDVPVVPECKRDFLLTQKGNIIVSEYNHTCVYGENNITNPECFKESSSGDYYFTRSLNGIVKKGTIVIARSVTANGKTDQFFYTDKDYKIIGFQGGYNSYIVLEPIEEEPEEPVTPDEPKDPEEPSNPEEPSEQVDDYKLDLKCLNDKDGSHHCELYYNGKNNDSGEFEVKFRVQAKNVKGTININNKDLELESNKEYTVNGKCSDADCKVLLARFNTKDINKNSSSSMEIEPVSLRIDGEDKPINIENSKCEYSKVIENPKTSTYIILVATIIFIVFGGLLIVLRKKEVLTKV